MSKTKTLLTSILILAMLSGLVACGNSAETDAGVIDTQTYEFPQRNLEYHNISVIPPVSARAAALESGGLEELEHNLQVTQEYFDTTMLDFSSPTLYFVPLRGIYTHADQEMWLLGAFVNRHENPLASFSGRIRMQADIAGMEIATITFDFPQEFVGILQTNEALLVTFNVPARGLEEDSIIEAYQFISELIDVVIVEN